MELWDNLSATKRKKVVYLLALLCLVVVGYLAYIASGRGKTEVVQKKEEKLKMTLDSQQLEKGLYVQTEKKIRKQEEEMYNELKKIKDDLAEFKRKSSEEMRNRLPGSPEEKGPPKEEKTVISEIVSNIELDEKPEVKPNQKFPEPPAMPAQSLPIKPAGDTKNLFPTSPPTQAKPKKFAMVGGVEVVTNKAKSEGAEKKKPETIRLPPCYMRGTLLSGVQAPASMAGKKNPVPMLIKIDNLAVLPNRLKADLKGCFVIAEGVGNLQTHRVDTRLVNLACVGKKGQSIIDQEVNGFVVDADGQVDLKGRVVAKMGTHLARVGLAGLLGGAAEGVEKSSYTEQFSPATGVVQRTMKDDTESILKLSVGKGLQSTAKELQKFYLDLAQQTLPVIEVGPTKEIHIVIKKGLELKIEPTNSGGGGLNGA